MFILPLASNVALRGPLFATLHLDGKMNVPRAAGIQSWLDRAEIVFAGGTSKEPAETLKILVAPRVIVAAGMQINSVVIDLPDFNQRIAYGGAFRVEDASAEVRDLDRKSTRLNSSHRL